MKDKKTSAVIPGSYDPITCGHLDLIVRASKLFDEVTVLICVNSSKRGFVDAETRKILCEDAVRDIPNVKVDVCGGLFADYCHNSGKLMLPYSEDNNKEEFLAFCNSLLSAE